MGLRGKITCPCCGYKTLSEARVYEICSICFWEDDPYQRDRVKETGANNVSLAEGQVNYVGFGACDRERVPYVRTPNAQDSKGEDWVKY